MNAEQHYHHTLSYPRTREYVPSLPQEVWTTLSFSLLKFFSTEERLRAKAHEIELPNVTQTEGTQAFGFYTDLQEYVTDLKQFGTSEARTRLHARLYSSLATMDQEARRKLTTHPIPMHFVPDAHSSHFFWRAIGRRANWKTELLERNNEKPDGAEKSRFSLEINGMIKAFEQLLTPLESFSPKMWELLSETKKEEFLCTNLGYTKRSIEVTRHLTLLFPALADQYGKKIDCVVSPNALHVYTPSEFHLGSASSFFYIKNIAYVSNLGFVGLDQGLMSGYMLEDQKSILSQLTDLTVTEWNVEQLMTHVFSLKPELARLPPDDVFEQIKQIIPFKSLEMTEHVHPQSCGEKEYRNYIQVIQSIFEKEIAFLSSHPEFAPSSQERNEVFSRYIAFALGLKDKLPKRKMLSKYQSILDDREIARNPKDHLQKIDTSVASIYGHLASIPLRLESMIECSVIGGVQASIGRISSNSLRSVFGERLVFSGETRIDLQNAIGLLRDNDMISEEQARIFAAQYAINPNWIGDVIKYYPAGKYCQAGTHTAHWVGQCGDHTMCLACNAQYNLDHGMVDMNQETENTEAMPEWLQQLLSQVSVSSVNVSDFFSGLFNKEAVYKDKIQEVSSAA